MNYHKKIIKKHKNKNFKNNHKMFKKMYQMAITITKATIGLMIKHIMIQMVYITT